VALRARLLGAHTQALADRGRDDEATRAGAEAVELAERAGLRDVADEVRVVVAKVRERTGDPEQSQQALEQILADPAVRGTPAESRALHHLGSLHHRAGRLREAVEVYQRGAARARAVGREWAPYALECRLLGGIAAYELGDWDLATAILARNGTEAPLMARALLDAALLHIAAGRGDVAALAGLPAIRRWRETEGLIGLLAATAAIDLHGDSGDLDSAVAAHDEVVEMLERLWRPGFQARLRLSGLMVGQLASHAAQATSGQRRLLLARGEELAEVNDSVWTRSVQDGLDGPEAAAWDARTRSEWLRLQWLAGASRVPDLGAMEAAWRETVQRFDTYGHAFEGARSRARLAAVLRASGSTETAEVVEQAVAVARRLGAAPLLAELRPLLGGRDLGPQAGSEHLTPREREILGLVALGRTNKQIGTQLFISAKTASVHVSNIMAKLGATGRGEAVAVARQRGLLD
jgi:DNA-binding CsgD family transcriptional regulator/tetratricopeptide (TPR) repeat protein